MTEKDVSNRTDIYPRVRHSHRSYNSAHKYANESCTLKLDSLCTTVHTKDGLGAIFFHIQRTGGLVTCNSRKSELLEFFTVVHKKAERTSDFIKFTDFKFNY